MVMNAEEFTQKKISVEKLAKAIQALPEDKKSYFMGYAEGFGDAKKTANTETTEPDDLTSSPVD